MVNSILEELGYLLLASIVLSSFGSQAREEQYKFFVSVPF